MTIEECIFAADHYLPVVADGLSAAYERIYQLVKTWPDAYRRQRGQHSSYSVVLMDPNRNSVRTVPPDWVHPADPERFAESYAAYRKNSGNKK